MYSDPPTNETPLEHAVFQRWRDLGIEHRTAFPSYDGLTQSYSKPYAYFEAMAKRHNWVTRLKEWDALKADAGMVTQLKLLTKTAKARAALIMSDIVICNLERLRATQLKDPKCTMSIADMAKLDQMGEAALAKLFEQEGGASRDDLKSMSEEELDRYISENEK